MCQHLPARKMLGKITCLFLSKHFAIEAQPISSVSPPPSPLKIKIEDSSSYYSPPYTSLFVEGLVIKEPEYEIFYCLDVEPYFQMVIKLFKCSTAILYMLMKLQMHNVPFNLDFRSGD